VKTADLGVGFSRYGSSGFASRSRGATSRRTSAIPAISPNSEYRSATFTIADTLRPGVFTSGPATSRGTQTPVWYAVPFARDESNGLFTVVPRLPLSPSTISMVFVSSGW
jgi:hypothetical protein